jgi:SAM-dependent methyltransferase
MADLANSGTATSHGDIAPRIFEPDYYERMRRLEAVSWWNAGMRNVAQLLLERVALPPEGTLLDVGCGSGQTMQWALGILGRGWDAIGLDVASEGVEAARAAGLNVLHASALDIPLPDASVDLILTLDVLQHLPLGGGDVQALREMRRVLKPHGVLFVRTNAQAFPRTQEDPEFNFRKYEPTALRTALVSAGFEVRRLSRINALLGLAEIPRELQANRDQHRDGYHGLLAQAITGPAWLDAVKRWWLTWEGRAVSTGIRLPFGRTMVALAVRGRTSHQSSHQ